MNFLIANAKDIGFACVFLGDALAVAAFYLGRSLMRYIKERRRERKVTMQLLEEMYHAHRQKDVVSDIQEIPL